MTAPDDADPQGASRVGSGDWVRSQLSALPPGAEWGEHPAGRELLQWLSAVVRHRAASSNLLSYERADIAQDAMLPILRTLAGSRERIEGADNPAAVLERVAARAVAAGGHRARMAGLGGVAANGQNWHARYPRQIGREAALRMLAELPTPVHESCRQVEDAGTRVARWVCAQLGVRLTEDAVHAVVYVLDRLVAGVSRGALLRGAHSGLGTDPAMRCLGFRSPAASAFGVWLLGRHDAGHNAPSVLNAALYGEAPDNLSVERWRRVALRAGFAIGNQRHAQMDRPNAAGGGRRQSHDVRAVFPARAHRTPLTTPLSM